jgi:cell division protein FtsB
MVLEELEQVLKQLLQLAILKQQQLEQLKQEQQQLVQVQLLEQVLPLVREQAFSLGLSLP